jgi:putative Mg2+ transporter-C (MgtC) family protein
LTVDLQVELLLRIGAAAGLGSIIGIERDLRSHPAGLRTHALVALGACLFSLGGAYGFVGVGAPHDPTRVAAQVASGIGFLGAGAILRQGRDISGLTTAATLWLSAAIGLACASDQMILAVGATLIALLVVVLGRLSKTSVRGRQRRVVVVRYRTGHGTLAPVLAILNDFGHVGHVAVDDAAQHDGTTFRQLSIEVERLRPKDLAHAIDRLLAIPEVTSVNTTTHDSNE